MNFGPVPRVALPFTCHMLQQAAAEDVEVKASKRGVVAAMFAT